MGISANQARLMTLTARQHDLELRAQQISAQKMITSLESQQLAMDYSNALNVYSQMKTGDVNNEDLNNVMNTLDINFIALQRAKKAWTSPSVRYIVSSSGGILTSNLGNTYSSPEALADYVATVMRANNVTLTPQQFLNEVDSDDLLNKKKADYDAAVASLSTQEKLLDMELTQINTEHNAVKTEYDSVKGLVSENTDKSFNVFS